MWRMQEASRPNTALYMAIFFSNKIYGSRTALGNCYGLKLPKCWLQFKKKYIVIYYNFRHTFVPYWAKQPRCNSFGCAAPSRISRVTKCPASKTKSRLIHCISSGRFTSCLWLKSLLVRFCSSTDLSTDLMISDQPNVGFFKHNALYSLHVYQWLKLVQSWGPIY